MRTASFPGPSHCAASWQIAAGRHDGTSADRGVGPARNTLAPLGSDSPACTRVSFSCPVLTAKGNRRFGQGATFANRAFSRCSTSRWGLHGAVVAGLGIEKMELSSKMSLRAGRCNRGSRFAYMDETVRRLNVALDPEHAARLALLAERTHAAVDTVAESLLSAAIDKADPDTRHVVEILDGIRDAYGHAVGSLQRGRAGETVDLDEL